MPLFGCVSTSCLVISFNVSVAGILKNGWWRYFSAPSISVHLLCPSPQSICTVWVGGCLCAAYNWFCLDKCWCVYCLLVMFNCKYLSQCTLCIHCLLVMFNCKSLFLCTLCVHCLLVMFNYKSLQFISMSMLFVLLCILNRRVGALEISFIKLQNIIYWVNFHSTYSDPPYPPWTAWKQVTWIRLCCNTHSS